MRDYQFFCEEKEQGKVENNGNGFPVFFFFLVLKYIYKKTQVWFDLILTLMKIIILIKK